MGGGPQAPGEAELLALVEGLQLEATGTGKLRVTRIHITTDLSPSKKTDESASIAPRTGAQLVYHSTLSHIKYPTPLSELDSSEPFGQHSVAPDNGSQSSAGQGKCDTCPAHNPIENQIERNKHSTLNKGCETAASTIRATQTNTYRHPLLGSRYSLQKAAALAREAERDASLNAELKSSHGFRYLLPSTGRRVTPDKSQPTTPKVEKLPDGWVRKSDLLRRLGPVGAKKCALEVPSAETISVRLRALAEKAQRNQPDYQDLTAKGNTDQLLQADGDNDTKDRAKQNDQPSSAAKKLDDSDTESSISGSGLLAFGK